MKSSTWYRTLHKTLPLYTGSFATHTEIKKVQNNNSRTEVGYLQICEMGTLLRGKHSFRMYNFYKCRPSFMKHTVGRFNLG